MMSEHKYEVVVVSAKTSKTVRHEYYYTLEKAEWDFEKFKKGYPRAFITLKHCKGRVIKASY
jgi:hypothetical protein